MGGKQVDEDCSNESGGVDGGVWTGCADRGVRTGNGEGRDTIASMRSPTNPPGQSNQPIKQTNN